MADVDYSIRRMRREDVPQAVEAWMETGMLIGIQSVYSWMTVDPEGFYVAVTDSGEVIGACGAVIHHENLACIGLYVVREKYRGNGIGYKVWSTCMEHVGTRNTGLNSVPKEKDIYQRRDAFPVEETEWVVLVNITTNTVNPEALSNIVPEGVDIQTFQESHLPSIFKYDFSLIGYKRYLALELNCKEEDSRTLVALKGGVCVGYGTIKAHGPDAVKVGPLYADDAAVAEVMLRRLIMCFCKVKGFVMMTTSNNKPASDFMKRIGCPVIDKCYRLYSKNKVNVDLDKVFAQFDLHFSPC